MAESSITAMSNRKWIDTHQLKLQRYLRRHHKLEDRATVFDLLFMHYPDEGRKLIENYDLSDLIKKQLFLQWIVEQPQISLGAFGDQRMGKDATLCEIIEEGLQYCEDNFLPKPRVVTLGNLRKPPFVDSKDMYFSFKNIPSGSLEKEVWIYSTEIETVLPAREGAGPENRLFSQLEGTMAQNHQKLFGCCKLASKVDINFIRGMNCKIFKYISPEKLAIPNVERDMVLTGLGKWHLPSNPYDKSSTLLAFNNQLFTVNYDLPDWWDETYSEQFRNIPMDKIWEYVDVQWENGLKPFSIQIAVAQKFRTQLTVKEIKDHLGLVI